MSGVVADMCVLRGFDGRSASLGEDVLLNHREGLGRTVVEPAIGQSTSGVVADMCVSRGFDGRSASLREVVLLNHREGLRCRPSVSRGRAYPPYDGSLMP
nr:hypothetical protein ISGA_08255 [Gordonia sp. NB41Y]